MNIDPKDLLRLAEAVGKKHIRVEPRSDVDIVWFIGNDNSYESSYNPLTNNAQALELVKHFMPDANMCGDSIWRKGKIWKVQFHAEGFVGQSENLNEAIVLASLECLK